MTRTTISDLLAEARARLARLEPEAALAAQRSGAIVVDTRSVDERTRDGVIPGSLHIPLSVLPWRLDPETEDAYRNPYVSGLDTHVILVCAHGYSSSIAAATLQGLGFSRATDLAGGFVAWKEHALPVSPAPDSDPDTLPGMGPPDPSLAPSRP